eukprot:11188458-Lingulodinium_polyedra.AAC.1
MTPTRCRDADLAATHDLQGLGGRPCARRGVMDCLLGRGLAPRSRRIGLGLGSGARGRGSR